MHACSPVFRLSRISFVSIIFLFLFFCSCQFFKRLSYKAMLLIIYFRISRKTRFKIRNFFLAIIVSWFSSSQAFKRRKYFLFRFPQDSSRPFPLARELWSGSDFTISTFLFTSDWIREWMWNVKLKLWRRERVCLCALLTFGSVYIMCMNARVYVCIVTLYNCTLCQSLHFISLLKFSGRMCETLWLLDFFCFHFKPQHSDPISLNVFFRFGKIRHDASLLRCVNRFPTLYKVACE